MGEHVAVVVVDDDDRGGEFGAEALAFAPGQLLQAFLQARVIGETKDAAVRMRFDELVGDLGGEVGKIFALERRRLRLGASGVFRRDDVGGERTVDHAVAGGRARAGAWSGRRASGAWGRATSSAASPVLRRRGSLPK